MDEESTQSPHHEGALLLARHRWAPSSAEIFSHGLRAPAVERQPGPKAARGEARAPGGAQRKTFPMADKDSKAVEVDPVPAEEEKKKESEDAKVAPRRDDEEEEDEMVSGRMRAAQLSCARAGPGVGRLLTINFARFARRHSLRRIGSSRRRWSCSWTR